MWGKPTGADGPGYSLVAYMPITPELWSSMKAAKDGHLELLWRFLHADEHPDPEAIYNRFKLIGRLTNPDDPELAFNSTCARLVKVCGRGVGYGDGRPRHCGVAPGRWAACGEAQLQREPQSLGQTLHSRVDLKTQTPDNQNHFCSKPQYCPPAALLFAATDGCVAPGHEPKHESGAGGEDVATTGQGHVVLALVVVVVCGCRCWRRQRLWRSRALAGAAVDHAAAGAGGDPLAHTPPT